MADNNNDAGREFEKDKETGEQRHSEFGQQGQAPQGQQSQPSEFGQSGGQPTGSGGQSGASEFGAQSGSQQQGELTGQSETSLADRTGQQGGGQQPGGIEGTGGSHGGSHGGEPGSSFVGSQGQESGDYLRQDEQGSQDQDFAEQGRGALKEDEESGDLGKPGSF